MADKKTPPTPDHIGHRQRLREKFLKGGLDGFQDYEVVEFLLSLATPRRDCKPMAKAALAKFKSLQGVLDAPVAELCKITGIGETNAVPLKLIKAVATRYFRSGLKKIDLIKDPQVLIDYLKSDIGGESRECFKVIFLDAKNCVLAMDTLFKGTTTASAVYIKEISKAVLHYNAVSIICAHNHPSGNTQPSADDVKVTKQIMVAGRIVDYQVVDHLIVSTAGCFSFKDYGILDQLQKELDKSAKNDVK